MVRVIIEKLIQCPKRRSPFYIGHTGEECKVWLGTMLVVQSRFNCKGLTRSTVKLTQLLVHAQHAAFDHAEKRRLRTIKSPSNPICTHFSYFVEM